MMAREKLDPPVRREVTPAARSSNLLAKKGPLAGGTNVAWVGEILGLQRTVGNQAVAEFLERQTDAGRLDIQRNPLAVLAAPVASTHPDWTRDQLATIQRELRRLGLYGLAIDKIFGPGTRSGLVEAFGGEEWVTLAPDEVINRLKAASPPTGNKGEHRFRYGEMFKDGILDITVGVGFDETGAHGPEVAAIKAGLKARGFADDHVLASLLLLRAHRSVALDAFGEFWVKPKVLSYAPPAGPPRAVNAVVRLVYSMTGKDGDKAAGAMQEGMTQSDVAFYAGHARVGSGPDFSGVFEHAEVFNAAGQSVKRIEDFDALELYLETPPPDGGKRHGLGAWGEFNAYNPVLSPGGNLSDGQRRTHHLMLVPSPNAHLLLNQTMVKRGVVGFERRLIYWIVEKSGVKAITGKHGALAKAAAAQPDRKYRVVVFNACTTQDYKPSVQGTPGLDPRSADLIMSQRETLWAHYADGLLAFLDSIVAQQSAEQTVKAMNQAEPDDETSKAAFGPGSPAGMALDPTIR